MTELLIFIFLFIVFLIMLVGLASEHEDSKRVNKEKKKAICVPSWARPTRYRIVPIQDIGYYIERSFIKWELFDREYIILNDRTVKVDHKKYKIYKTEQDAIDVINKFKQADREFNKRHAEAVEWRKKNPPREI